MKKSPKVSIIVPVYNVEQYLQPCLDSLLNQTLKDIEIICVNDGSTDHSLEILQENEKRDERIILISKPNSGYGHTMNVGINHASGQYIGFVESDDFVLPEMYETLYHLAVKNKVDFIKADFYRFVHDSNGNIGNTYNSLTNIKKYYNKVLNPQKDIQLFNLIMNTWSGIYSSEFLNRFRIRHNETPGASFQDNGFYFQTFCRAERVYFLDKPFYMNRRDNPNSSVHDRRKVFCMCDEYEYIKDFLIENNLWQKFRYIYSLKKVHNYHFTYTRIGEEYKLEFLSRYSEELRKAMLEGDLDKSLFSSNLWRDIVQIINDPESFFCNRSAIENTSVFREERNQLTNEINKSRTELQYIYRSRSWKVGKVITFFPRKIRVIVQTLFKQTRIQKSL